jgi:hypothetical protein
MSFGPRSSLRRFWSWANLRLLVEGVDGAWLAFFT